MSLHQTRIITGSLKGRVLQLPQSEAARPTRGRIRQAAFNILQGYTDFTGLTVADVCCGSGAWGLEALSRGAAQVYLIDTDPTYATRNAKALGASQQVSIVTTDAARWQPPQPVDVVLADPPYADLRLLHALLNNAPMIGKPGALWLLETASTTPPSLPPHFTLLTSRTYGTSALHLLRQSS